MSQPMTLADLKSYEETTDFNNSGENFKRSFLKLEDKQKVVVRFMHRTIESIPAAIHHTIKKDNKYLKIKCLRQKGDSKEVCPLCNSGDSVSMRIYIDTLLYELDQYGRPTGKSELFLFDAPLKFTEKLEFFVETTRKSLFETVCYMKRNGLKLQTSYDLAPVSFTEQECPIIWDEEAFNPVGRVVKEKTYQELDKFIQTGEFPEVEESVTPRPSKNEQRPPYYQQQAAQASYPQPQQQAAQYQQAPQPAPDYAKSYQPQPAPQYQPQSQPQYAPQPQNVVPSDAPVPMENRRVEENQDELIKRNRV